MKMVVPTRKEAEPLSDRLPLPSVPAWKARLHSKASAWARSPGAHRLLSALLLIGLPGIGAYAHRPDASLTPRAIERKRVL